MIFSNRGGGECFPWDGKTSVPDPDSIRSVDPETDSESGSRQSKMIHKNGYIKN
jgi:hypothetical protein